MGAAIGLAAIIIVLGMFLPTVLHGLETFLLTFLDRATAVVGSISPDDAAQVFRTIR